MITISLLLISIALWIIACRILKHEKVTMLLIESYIQNSNLTTVLVSQIKVVDELLELTRKDVSLLMRGCHTHKRMGE